MTARLTITAARNVDFAPTINLYYSVPELPLAGATIRMQVRLYAGEQGPALLSIGSIDFIDESAATERALSRRVLRLFPRADKSALAAMPTALVKPEAGRADVFYHDAIITYADGAEDRLIAGDFMLEAGITIDG